MGEGKSSRSPTQQKQSVWDEIPSCDLLSLFLSLFFLSLSVFLSLSSSSLFLLYLSLSFSFSFTITCVRLRSKDRASSVIQYSLLSIIIDNRYYVKRCDVEITKYIVILFLELIRKEIHERYQNGRALNYEGLIRSGSIQAAARFSTCDDMSCRRDVRRLL